MKFIFKAKKQTESLVYVKARSKKEAIDKINDNDFEELDDISSDIQVDTTEVWTEKEWETGL